jgi:hypothetical protein
MATPVPSLTMSNFEQTTSGRWYSMCLTARESDRASTGRTNVDGLAMNKNMEAYEHPMTIMFKQCYRCRVIYGHEEVPTPSGNISHGLCGLCLPKEMERLGLRSENQSVLPSGRL